MKLHRPLQIFAVVAASLTLAYTVAAYSLDASDTKAAEAERGRYLVTAFGCADCHSPWTLGPDGPAPDPTRFLAGHPADFVVPPAPALGDGPWIGAFAATNTAWAGPWGVSFTANLTPDAETGLGRWSAEDFVATVRTGRHLGRGRQLLPPMPTPALANLTDADLRAMFAFLRTIPAIENRVPEPVAPAATK